MMPGHPDEETQDDLEVSSLLEYLFIAQFGIGKNES